MIDTESEAEEAMEYIHGVASKDRMTQAEAMDFYYSVAYLAGSAADAIKEEIG